MAGCTPAPSGALCAASPRRKAPPPLGASALCGLRPRQALRSSPAHRGSAARPIRCPPACVSARRAATPKAAKERTSATQCITIWRMSAALKLVPAIEPLSEKPRLGKKITRPRLVWENPALTGEMQKGKLKAKLDSSYGRVLYNYFRYYDPSTGRYMTSDPIGLEGGLNLYSYVENNPLNLVDYYGLSSFLFVRPSPIVTPRWMNPRAGETAQQYQYRQNFFRQLERSQWKTQTTKNPVPPKYNPQPVNDSWFGLLGRLIKSFEKFNDFFMLPPVIPGEGDAGCPPDGNQRSEEDWQQCVLLGLCV